ncbi:S8 family peptidase [Streptomyces sp. NPDC050418]|uniref:S8 family peptidase n=1 Tax=Streptomyces sp. NPDC050418 TaxID=3365612 RepID=UPI0037BC45FC
MRRQTKRAGITTVAVAAAVALAAGMTGPAAAAKPAVAGAGAPAAESGPVQRIQLITGDRVVVDAKGEPVGYERAEGRAKIPVSVKRANGHTFVVPFDARRLIAEGRLDQRLFDLTVLAKAENRKVHKDGLRLIVGYKGAAAAAKSDVRDAGDTKVRRTLKTLNAEAVSTPRHDTTELWEALTNEQRSGARTTAAGVGKVWLDGVRKASLDRSVAQIGADKAWAAGYDGTGVKIAVLDTGIRADHADLKDRIVGARNFSPPPPADGETEPGPVDPDATDDKYGHGTHVASIAAGTGAASAGKYKGVAPGAGLLNGKVLNDQGYGEDSAIVAGIDWAVAEGADVVNLSLGGPDSPGTDPLEAAVDRHSRENGVLFAIASGNDGPETLGSPSSAETALAVGAVDKSDKLADFSSTGPRVGDGGIKPDVTAPGVDITAAAAKGSLIDLENGVPHPAPGYLTISGTSMATPHAAGAAALLKQQHPDWTYAELKSVLVASAKGGAYTPFEQGAGRIQADKALTQTVYADPVSLSFGLAQWPHTDDPLLTKKLTYRNTGDEDVTLDLSVKGLDPKGQAAPAGFFALGAAEVTVPAGGSAAVDVTVDTKLGGTLDGSYSAYVTATGGGQSVRTAAAVQREVESYDVTLKHIGRDGQPATAFDSDLEGISGLAAQRSFDADDEGPATVELRVPKGGYLLNAAIMTDPADFTKGADWIAQPKLSVTKNTTITLDARATKPVKLTMPEASARAEFASPDWSYDTDHTSYSFGWFLDGYQNFRTLHLGPEVADGALSQRWDGHFLKGASTQYSVVYGKKVTKLATGWTKTVKKGDLARLKVGMGASVPGKQGRVYAYGTLPGSSGSSALGAMTDLPGTRTLYVSVADKVRWRLDFDQFGGRVDEQGWPVEEASYTLGAAQTYAGGKTYEKTFNNAVFGPKLNSGLGVYRQGNEIFGSLPLLGDGKNHTGGAPFSSVKTVLYRNGAKLGENDNPLNGYPSQDGYPGEGSFKVPSGEASYKLTTSAKRDLTVARTTSKVNATFTFKSKKVTQAKLPVSVVRFSPALALDATAPAGKKTTMPVTVQGAAAGKNLKYLKVYVSYDNGKTWKKLTVTKGKVAFKHPAKGKSVSFHAKLGDRKGNTTAMSVYDAYYGK